MQKNFINPRQANIDKSYILKVQKELEKYIEKTSDGKYVPSQLINATIFENYEKAKQVADMLNQEGHDIEIVEVQNRTRW